MLRDTASNNMLQSVLIWHKYPSDRAAEGESKPAVGHQANRASLISPGICSDLVQVIAEKMSEHNLSGSESTWRLTTTC